MRIYWATRLRGFLKHVSTNLPDIEFIGENGYYETNSLLQRIKSQLIHLKIFDSFGVFQVTNITDKDCDYYASFNRFLKTDKPYFIYLENPTALYHYELNRIKYKLGKKRFNKCLNNKNLRGIICMSNACRDSFESINCELPENMYFDTIYPLVPDDKNISIDDIKHKSSREELKLLYCVQGVRFISKGGLETLESFKRIRKNNKNISLTIITKISDVDIKIIKDIERTEGITLLDFSFPFEDLRKIYEDTNILIQPSSDDSFGLTVLEAMKSGCVVIASDLYAFPEMVENGVNGYLLAPKYRFFDCNKIPNPAVWNNRSKTIYAKTLDERLTSELVERIKQLYDDRDILYSFSLQSYLVASGDGKFGEKVIIDKWGNLLNRFSQNNKL